MYRTYKLTDAEKDKITKYRWDGDTGYYDVFESQEECDKEEERLRKINEDAQKMHKDYLKNLKDEESIDGARDMEEDERDL